MKKQIYTLAIIAGTFLYHGSQAQTSTPVNPDNSAVNKRDHTPQAKTADHQAQGTKSDTEMTRMIRRTLTKDDSLSTYAKNIKIVTTSESVTLRGPVRSEDEKNKIGAVAQKIAENRTVQNELEVKQ